MTIWKMIPGWEIYEVSIDGGVRRRAGSPKTPNGRLLKGHKDKDGYPFVHLRMDGKAKHMGIHIAILLAFVGPKPTARHQSAHRDGIISNSVLSNLRWATPKENCADRSAHGRHPRGEDHVNCKLQDADIAEILSLSGSCALIARKFSCSAELIRRVRIGRRVASVRA